MFRFLNYHRHPEKKGYWVFYFKEKISAEYFEKEAKESGLPAQKLIDPDKPDIFYFSVHKDHFDAAHIINAEAQGQTPRSFIPDRGLRVFLMVFFLVCLGLALVGYIVSHF